MRGWSALGSVPLMGSGVFGWSLLMARWIDSKAYALFPYIYTSKYIILKDRHIRAAEGRAG